MKKIFFLITLMFFSINISFGEVKVFSQKNKFGLEENGETIIEPIFSKLIHLGDDSYLFCYKKKYGVISKYGDILVEPKYTNAQRFFSKYARLGSLGSYGLFDDTGDMIIEKKYTSINILFGRMFLVEKNYKYGLISFDGDIILAPVADDIYMPNPHTLKILYEGVWYTIEQKDQEEITLPDDILGLDSSKFNIISIVEQPITSTSYGLVSASDYLIKFVSSISPAYEQTIDELVLDHGADTASILLAPSWLVKFPVLYTKNYFLAIKAPDNGPLSGVKTKLRGKLKS